MSTSRRPRASRRRWFPALAIALLTLAIVSAPALGQGALGSAAEPPAVPARVVAPLSEDGNAAVVSYPELVRAARQGKLNAAVVDTQALWAAAVDGEGHVIAAQIPHPQAGRDYASSRPDAQREGGLPGAFTLAEVLAESGVALVRPPQDAAAPGSSRSTLRMLLMPLGFALAAMFIVGGMLLIRGRSGGRGGAGGGSAAHGRIRKSALVSAPAVRFDDVAGCDEAVEELREVVTFLAEPDRFARVGAKMPRGVALHGPPGTGKTLLAKAVAGEAGVPFFAMSGSDFVDTYVGVGAARVRDLFAEARKSDTGAIIFFDEIDAIGRARSGGPSGGDSEREGTLNQLLVELDGFGARDRIVVVAATNRLDMLDQALLRPGRFDRRVQVGLPAEAGRLAILRLHAAGMPLADPADLEALARVTAGFAGADLANMLNEAAIMAARAGREAIAREDLDEGMLRAIAGPEKRDRKLAPGELETIAWHEAGHCLAAELCPTHDKAQRITILARGDAGGLALYGTADRALTSPQHLHERMIVAMAGRAAEQLRFDAISSGAANDLEQVNRIAREAVERLGFSSRVGQLVSSAGPQQMPLSGETRQRIDHEVARMVESAYGDALALLRAHRRELDRLAELLLEREQIDRVDIERALGSLRRTTRATPTPQRAPAVAEEPIAAPARGGRRRRVRRMGIPQPGPVVRAGAGALASLVTPRRRARRASALALARTRRRPPALS